MQLLRSRDRVQNARKRLEPQLASGVAEACEAFWKEIGPWGKPGAINIAAGASAAQAILERRVLSDEWVSALSGDQALTQGQRALIEKLFSTFIPPLAIPEPQDASTESATQVGLTAACGAICGMALLTPIARLLFDMRDTGLFVGAPLGGAIVKSR